jgi:O-antigen ligase
MLSPYKTVYERATFVAFSLLSVGIIRPHPSDALLLGLLIIGVANGCLRLAAAFSDLAVTFLLSCFWMFYLLSAILNTVDLVAIGNLLVNMFLFYFLRLYIDSRARMRTVLFGYLTSVIGTAALGICIRQGLVTYDVFNNCFPGLRFAGLMSDPNVLGSYSVPAAIWLLDELLNPTLWKCWIIWKSAALAAVVLLVSSTFSRGAWLNLAVGVVAYLLLRGRTFMKARCLTVRAIILAGTVLTIVLTFEHLGYVSIAKSRLSLRLEDDQRFDYQRRGMEVSARTVFGIGPMRSTVTQLQHPPHNFFLQVLQENGWCSLFAMVCLLGLFGIRHARAIGRRKDRVCGLSHAVILSCFLGLLVNSLFIDVLYWRILWLILGLAWVTSSDLSGRGRDSTDQTRKRRVRLRTCALRALHSGPT